MYSFVKNNASCARNPHYQQTLESYCFSTAVQRMRQQCSLHVLSCHVHQNERTLLKTTTTTLSSSFAGLATTRESETKFFDNYTPPSIRMAGSEYCIRTRLLQAVWLYTQPHSQHNVCMSVFFPPSLSAILSFSAGITQLINTRTAVHALTFSIMGYGVIKTRMCFGTGPGIRTHRSNYRIGYR